MQPLVKAVGLTKSYGSKHVLDGASFVLHPKDKVAVVGPNGAGKTTLFRLLIGQEKPEAGDFVRPDALRVAYLPQVPDVPFETPVVQVLATPSETARAIQRELLGLEQWMAQPDAWDAPDASDKMSRYNDLQARLGEEQSKSQVADNPILGDLGVSPETVASRFGALSGGEKSKVLLARALGNAKDMDLLVLDEPTNHMDIPTVEWIEEYLFDLDAAVLLSAHDQYLLDNVASRVFEVDRRKILAYDGNYTDYIEQKQAITRAWDARRKRHFAEVKRQAAIVEELKRRNKFDSDISARRRRVEQMRGEMAEGPQSSSRGFRLLFNPAKKSGRDVMAIEGVARAFDGRRLFEDVGFEVERGDKIGVIGLNGTGKTTLLEMLVGRQAPDAGSIVRARGTNIGYFSQNHETLQSERTLYEEIRALREPPPSDGWTRGLLGRFRFSGDDVFKKVSTLSGGERARISIAKFVAEDHNLLVLDEPTNHLDIESQETVAQALEAYEGSIVVVSHNRSFLNRFVNKVAVIDHREVGVFVGNFNQAWTAAKVGEFVGGAEQESYKVLRGFRDWERRRDWTVGQVVQLTGAETQSFRRLLRWAEADGRIERAPGKSAPTPSG